MQNAEAALERLCDPIAEVSAHYLIGADGTLWRLVAEEHRAWHAGQGSWCGCIDINSRSVGIELDNDGASPFPNAQMIVLEDLLRGIMKRWSIGAEGVIGHSDMAPGRKWDPGPHFDWQRLEAQGLAARGNVGSGPANGDSNDFRQLARKAGYTSDVDDETLLAAVRLRHRPGANGPLSPEDFALLGNGVRRA